MATSQTNQKALLNRLNGAFSRLDQTESEAAENALRRLLANSGYSYRDFEIVPLGGKPTGAYADKSDTAQVLQAMEKKYKERSDKMEKLYKDHIAAVQQVCQDKIDHAEGRRKDAETRQRRAEKRLSDADMNVLPWKNECERIQNLLAEKDERIKEMEYRHSVELAKRDAMIAQQNDKLRDLMQAVEDSDIIIQDKDRKIAELSAPKPKNYKITADRWDALHEINDHSIQEGEKLKGLADCIKAGWVEVVNGIYQLTEAGEFMANEPRPEKKEPPAKKIKALQGRVTVLENELDLQEELLDDVLAHHEVTMAIQNLIQARRGRGNKGPRENYVHH